MSHEKQVALDLMAMAVRLVICGVITGVILAAVVLLLWGVSA
jgi:hypothetical protein